MTKRISLLLPTRGRPALVQRFLLSVREQATRPDLIEVILCVDEDDPGSHAIAFEGLDFRTIIVPRQNMGAYNAICLENSTGDITIAVNDDMMMRTRGWDDRVRQVDALFADGIYLAYGNDLFKGKKLCTFPILSRSTCEALAAPYPCGYRGAFIDVHLMDIFKRLAKAGHDRFVYAEDLILEHVHYRVDAGAMDATYADRQRFGDDMAFTTLADFRQSECLRLLAAVELGRAPARGENVADTRTFSERQPAPNVVTILPLCVRTFWLDFALPFTWRTYLCTWMIARFYYQVLIVRPGFKAPSSRARPV